MKIKLTKEDLSKVKTLLKTKENNIYIADLFLYFCANNANLIDKQLINDLISINKYSEEHAFYHLFINNLDIDIKDVDIVKQYCLKGIRKLDSTKYRDNPYFKNIHTSKIRSRNWEIKYEQYLPYEGFIYDDVSVEEDNYFLEIFKLGFFEEEFSYLAVSESNVNWMSVTPNEIETMQSSIDQVKGKVITFGLGLGYFAYMASIKNDVKSVTIIEKDKDIISLFSQYILPQFSCKDKIRIISMDAFDYVNKEMTKENYDYAFVDLWHGGEDGMALYLKMNKFEHHNKNTKFLYWLEKSILAMLRRCFLTILSEQLDGSTDQDYKKAANEVDDIINRMYFILKDYSINDYNDIVSLLKDSSLKEMAKKV